MYYGEDLFEEIAKLYPELAKKSLVDYFSTPPGWENIVKCLCQTIYSEVEYAQRELKYYESRELPVADDISLRKTALATALDELPVIVQVKEKFGTMRFQTTGATPAILSAIMLAQSLSGCTCEECGAPGQRESGDWIRTVCKNHSSKDELPNIPQGKVIPNLFTD